VGQRAGAVALRQPGAPAPDGFVARVAVACRRPEHPGGRVDPRGLDQGLFDGAALFGQEPVLSALGLQQ